MNHFNVSAPQDPAPAAASVEQDDLLISPYLDKAGLPTILRDLMPLAATPAQQDMLLLSVLTASGMAMPNTYFTYGPMRKPYFPHLICFIEAMAAQGKSIVSVGQQLLRKIHAEEPIFLAGDSTHAAFVTNFAEQFGRGFCYESEGSVVTDIWRRTGCNGYNSLLRKASEHEEYRLSRKTEDDIVIPCPRLSMLLTGTFDQFTALVPSASNGLFSRIIPMVIRENSPYDRHMALTVLPAEESAADGGEYSGEHPVPAARDSSPSALISFHATRLFRLKHALQGAERPIRFSLTSEQAAELGEAFYADSLVLLPRLGQNFHQSIARMTVHTLRIAHILSLLHLLDTPNTPGPLLGTPIPSAADTIPPLPFLGKGCLGEAEKGLLCSDADFHTALLLGRKFLLHAADAYLQIHADRTRAIPAARGSFQQQTFLSALPEEFTTEECLQLAANSGIAERSVARWLSVWVTEGVLAKPAKGFYRKAS